MTTKNDEVFANFMVRLARKILDRRNELDRYAEAVKAGNLSFAALLGSNSSLNVIGIDFAGGTIARSDVTDGEMAVIRAYFNGEDVLTTILYQQP